MSMSASVFTALQNITVHHLAETVFTGLNFSIQKGEQWILVGDDASGKTDLLRTMAGLYQVSGQRIYYSFRQKPTLEPAPTPAIPDHSDIVLVSGRHHFKNLSNTSNFYYQQRYHAIESEEAPTVASYLADLGESAHHGYWTLPLLKQRLMLESLMEKRLIQLSNGETRRLMLASALIRQPKLLLLDHPFTGLDVTMRPHFALLMHEIAKSGIHMVMASDHRYFPECFTHIAVLQDHKIVKICTRTSFSPADLPAGQKSHEEAIVLPESPPDYSYPVKGTEIIKLQNAQVKYGQTLALAPTNWLVKAGERWSVSGPNGAGKSTLLNLITGDHPQAYANNIWLFGKKRGTGESIWDIKKRIGYVSPEMAQYFDTRNTCVEVVAGGLFDTLGLFKQPNAEQWALAAKWTRIFGLEKMAHKPFLQLTNAQRRLCLLARAMIKFPPLLLLDEPCQGLDVHQQRSFRQMLDQLCSAYPISLVYVTHYQEELPDCINKTLELHTY